MATTDPGRARAGQGPAAAPGHDQGLPCDHGPDPQSVAEGSLAPDRDRQPVEGQGPDRLAAEGLGLDPLPAEGLDLGRRPVAEIDQGLGQQTVEAPDGGRDQDRRAAGVALARVAAEADLDPGRAPSKVGGLSAVPDRHGVGPDRAADPQWPGEKAGRCPAPEGQEVDPQAPGPGRGKETNEFNLWDFNS